MVVNETAFARAAEVWGDEGPAVRAAVKVAASRIIRVLGPEDDRSAGLGAGRGRRGDDHRGGIGADAALQVFDEVLVPATRAQDDPLNLAYIPAAPTRAAVAFDLVEQRQHLRRHLGGGGRRDLRRERGAGVAGVAARLAGHRGRLLRLRRHDRQPVGAGRGPRTPRVAAARRSRPEGGWKLACTAEAHSSIRSAAQVLDVDVVLVPERRARPPDRRGAAAQCSTTQPGVFAVVASAGTTNAGVVDDLADVADVCEELGRVAARRRRLRWRRRSPRRACGRRFAGIERADSFIVDPHKWLFAPYDCCALLYRDPRARAGRARPARELPGPDRPRGVEPGRPGHPPLAPSARAAVLVQPGRPTAPTATSRPSSRPCTTARDGRRRRSGTARTCGWSANPSCRSCCSSGPAGAQRTTAPGRTRCPARDVMLCVPTAWRGQTVLRLAFVNPATDPDKVIAILAETTA